MKNVFSEMLGTAILVFAGAGAMIVNDVTAGTITHVGIALTFGLVVMAMIYTLGDVSGAHLNPAVTIAFWLAGRFTGRRVAPYVLAQLTGACFAGVLLRILFWDHQTLGLTQPAGTAGQSFLLEVILSFILMLVILKVSAGSREQGLLAGVAIGGTVMLEAMFAGPICGASMNPARSFGPAIISGHLGCLWIYVLAPVIGMTLAVPSCALLGCECALPDAIAPPTIKLEVPTPFQPAPVAITENPFSKGTA